MKIVAISDTHNRHKQITIPECDVLIHAGDWTSMGHKDEVEKFAKWLDSLDQVKNIIVVPGNHELHFETHHPNSLRWITDHCPHAHILIDDFVMIDDVKIHGSPATPYFCDWAWNRMPSEFDRRMYVGLEKEKLIKSIKPHWDNIPEDVNILVTHGPPYDVLDKTTMPNGTPRPEPLGCPMLVNRIKELKDLDLHFFGHIHYQGGQQVHKDGVSYYNAAVCDEHYYPSNGITIVDYIKEERVK